MSNETINDEQYFHESRKKRLTLIRKLVKDGRITSINKLRDKLKEKGITCSEPTIKKDLKHCNIQYDSTTHRFRFKSDIESQVDLLHPNLNQAVLEIFRQCKIGIDDNYQVFKPIHYGGNQHIPLYLHCIMITCPLGYEELLYQTISSNLISFDIFTAQVNKGSVFFFFKSNSQKDFTTASSFYDALQKYY